MKVALLSDTHGSLPTIPEGVVSAVIHAGDIGVDRDPINWFRETFYPWARRQAVPVFATFGNHDHIGEALACPEGIPANLHLVTDALVDVLGVPVWFSPWSLRFMDWAFMANEYVLAMKYAKIPASAQVVVSHGPPFGFGDRTIDNRQTGSVALAERMLALPDLRLLVCGHIHEAHGVYACEGVPVMNVSILDEWYQPKHQPTVIDWPPPARVS